MTTAQKSIIGETMTALLEMPSTYTEIHEDEFDDIEGGIVWVPIVMGAVAAGGGLYASGQVAGERCYHAGLRNKEYQAIKWKVRALATQLAGAAGIVFMFGFENKFYSMI